MPPSVRVGVRRARPDTGDGRGIYPADVVFPATKFLVPQRRAAWLDRAALVDGLSETSPATGLYPHS
jgi:hypothetical protein